MCISNDNSYTFFPVAVFAEVSPESSKIQGEAITSRAGELKTNTLLDDSTTIDLHNDNTILRDVKVKKADGAGQVSFGPISIWLGANISYDVYNINDIYNYSMRKASEFFIAGEAGVRRFVPEWSVRPPPACGATQLYADSATGAQCT